MNKKYIVLLCLLFSQLSAPAQNAYFFPKKKFNPGILSPEAFLGYPIGSHHTRYDQLVAYFEYLGKTSDRVRYQTIGRTYEYRPQLMVVFSSPENLSRLEEIRTRHLELADPTRPMPGTGSMPVVMQLGYNVHGNEASGGEAALLTAYYLAAGEDPEVLDLMKNAVTFVEPVINPDGRDRFVNWVNMHKGTPLVADPNDREHHEVWPSGRVNHYWFDLNRDWLLAVHPESKNRLKFYHQWYPNVVTDHHEMGTQATHFFEPTKQTAENPLVPVYLYRNLNDTFARYFEEAMNEVGSLYYSKESFDNLYPGYGSTYPDIMGGIGFLFEQGSSRGHVQTSQHGELTFSFAVRNQLLNAIATLKASLAQRENLLKFQREFFSSAVTAGQKSAIKGYLVGASGDDTRTRLFKEFLLTHRIQCYDITTDIRQDGKTFQPGKTMFVPTAQPQYRLVQSIFERPTTFPDSLFYDTSAWNMPLAYGLPFVEVKSSSVKPGKPYGPTEPTSVPPVVPKSTYAYLVPATDFLSHKVLYQLLRKNVLVKVGFKPFGIQTSEGLQSFSHGTYLVPVASQKISPDSLHGLLTEIVKNTGVKIQAVRTGYSNSGVDLGSNNFETVTLPKVLMPVGQGTSPYEAGEVWYMMDTYVGMPVTKVELSQLHRVDLNHYTVLVMVTGQYPSDRNLVQKIKDWVSRGGTLITFKSASDWAIKNELSDEKIRENPKENTQEKTRLNYEDAVAAEGATLTGGAIFLADLDITHPLGFGYTNRSIALYRNSKTLLEPSKSPYTTVIQYDKSPLQNGYVHPRNLKNIAGSAGLLVSEQGNGRVILFADNPNFRGTWFGTSKLFFNAVFLGNKISVTGTSEQAQH
ncbi:M14 family zinc carboxypeptidase [Telluribacter sp.]|jgi:hypothetical protein|uniref:M14 family zinc carboxypeptidase n=1 Tax=Telluribacter sp. TaxID=1978767 RepID=UPI002E10C994|nr:M14 family zinc carboxypeptidase [Telluribacter sp.]